MQWMACVVASLSLALALTFGGGAAAGHYGGYDEPAEEQQQHVPSNMNVASYVQKCSGYENEDLPSECQDGGGKSDSMLSMLFGGTPSTPAPVPNSLPPPHQLPPMYYNDFYEDLLTNKRNNVHSAGCDCKVTNELLDLGSQHFPRYLMNAVCESRQEMGAKCRGGSNCKPLEYKIKVLTLATVEQPPRSDSLLWMPEDVRQFWRFKTVTVTAGCFCTK